MILCAKVGVYRKSPVLMFPGLSEIEMMPLSAYRRAICRAMITFACEAQQRLACPLLKTTLVERTSLLWKYRVSGLSLRRTGPSLNVSN